MSAAADGARPLPQAAAVWKPRGNPSKVLAVAMVCLIPLVFFMKRPLKAKDAAPMH